MLKCPSSTALYNNVWSVEGKIKSGARAAFLYGDRYSLMVFFYSFFKSTYLWCHASVGSSLWLPWLYWDPLVFCEYFPVPCPSLSQILTDRTTALHPLAQSKTGRHPDDTHTSAATSPKWQLNRTFEASNPKKNLFIQDVNNRLWFRF